MNFDFSDQKRRLHNTIIIATVEEIDWVKSAFRARRGDILTGWLPFPAFITNNCRYRFPLKKGAQVVLATLGGDLNTASVVTMEWCDKVPAPHLAVSERPYVELIEFEDGTIIKYDRRKSTLSIDAVGELRISAKNISLTSDKLTHNGVNIGATHTHAGVTTGSAMTGTPR